MPEREKNTCLNQPMNHYAQRLDAFRRYDVFVAESTRWGDPRAKLLTGE